jgi:hypothetical protein
MPLIKTVYLLLILDQWLVFSGGKKTKGIYHGLALAVN